MVKLVNTRDLKSLAVRLVGSSPTGGTNAPQPKVSGAIMPRLLCAFSALEFADEEIDEDPRLADCWMEYNPNSLHPFELWALF